MKGEVISFHLFDLGGALDLNVLKTRLADKGPTRPPPIGKGTPPYVEFPQPIVVASRSVELETPLGRLPAEVSVSYFPLGVASLRLRAPIEVADLSALRAWSQARVVGDEGGSLEAWARRFVGTQRAEWASSIREPYSQLMLNESYTVFAFRDVGTSASVFREEQGREIAGLLRGEDPQLLHDKEVQDTLRRWFSYYADDLLVIDWDSALIIDPSAEYEDLLFVLEIANLQLLEFRTYDDLLDDALARAYDDLEVLFRRPQLFRNARRTVHELSLLSIEIAELSDEVDNITKFLGDWFLARVYEATNEKFHLARWRATVDEKLARVNSLYLLANAESDNLRLMTLELLIVLLFILDLAVIFFK